MHPSTARFERRVVLAALAIIAALPGSVPAAGPDDLQQLTDWLTGSFSSAVQASEDPDFFDVSLQMARIWPDRTDGNWLYVEQALTSELDRPYRQRVLRLRELSPGLFESRVFVLPDPASVIGVWREDGPLADLTPADLTEREGCEVLMRYRDGSFIGSTLASLCTSTLRGAAYATSEVLITADGMISWDRGFAADGTQVWGSTKGGYVFDRIVDDAVPESAPESASDTETVSDTEPAPAPAPAPDESVTETESEHDDR
jgi:hypothetical protein